MMTIAREQSEEGNKEREHMWGVVLPSLKNIQDQGNPKGVLHTHAHTRYVCNP